MLPPQQHLPRATLPPMPPPPPGWNLWLVIPILCLTVFCCALAGVPFHAIALVFAISARFAYGHGDMDRTRRRLRLARIFAILGLVAGGLNVVVGVTAAIIEGNK